METFRGKAHLLGADKEWRICPIQYNGGKGSVMELSQRDPFFTYPPPTSTAPTLPCSGGAYHPPLYLFVSTWN